MDLLALILAQEHHKSETPFFVAGLVLAGFAVLISVFGFTNPDFPANGGAARGVMLLSVVLVAAAMFTAVYVSV